MGIGQSCNFSSGQVPAILLGEIMDYLTSVLYAFGAIQIFQMLPVLIAAQGSHKTIFEVFLDWLWAGIALVLMLLVSISYITVMRWVLEAPNSQPQFMFEVFLTLFGLIIYYVEYKKPFKDRLNSMVLISAAVVATLLVVSKSVNWLVV